MKSKFLFLLALPLALCGCNEEELGLYGLTQEQVAEFLVNNAEEWDNSFKNVFFTNYVMDVHYSQTGEHGYSVHNHIEVSDTAVMYQISPETHEEEVYFVKGENEWFAYMYNGDTGNYEPLTIEDFEGRYETIEAAKNSLVAEASLYVTFENYYDQFTFDAEKHEYYCASIIKIDLDDKIYNHDNHSMDLAAKEVYVKFDHGEISSMKADYCVVYDNADPAASFAAYEEQGRHSSFEITQVGKTVVQEPSNIVKA